MKKLVALLLALVIAVTTLAIPTSAATAKPKIWSGKSDTSWYTGDKDSYDISTAEQLAGLSELVGKGNSMSGVVFNLTNDIWLNDNTDWEKWKDNPPKNTFTPIGHSGNPVGGYYPFSGVLNGNGHAIRGLYVNSGRTAGLFGYLYCAGVTNLIIGAGVIIGYDNLKGMGVDAGGIAGIAEGSIINQCQNSAHVYALGQKDVANGDRTARCGGIVGSMQTENMSSVALGAALAAGGVFVNPLLFSDGSGGLIKASGIFNCITNGKVNIVCGTTAGHLGGIVGWSNNGTIRNCMAGNGWHFEKGIGNHGTIHRGQIAGGIYCCNIINSYYYDNGLKAVGQDMRTPVIPITVEAYKFDNTTSNSELADKLGDAFVFNKEDKFIYLACDQRLLNPTTETSTSNDDTDTVSYSKPTATVKNGKATIKWDKVENATKYIVKSKLSNGEYSSLQTTTKTTLTLSDLTKGRKYTLMVQAKLKDSTTVEIGKVSFTMTPGKVSKDGTYKMTIFGNTYTGKYTGAMTSSRVPNGKGTFSCKLSDGRTIKYSGQFKKGIKSGTGVLNITYSAGDVEAYRGKWVNDDLPDGTYSWDMSDGEYLTYRGKLVEGLFSGKGEMNYSLKEGGECTYKGDFLNDKRNGTGVDTYTYPNGDTVKYEGSFADGKLNGKIKITSTINGKTTVCEQEYKNGVLVE